MVNPAPVDQATPQSTSSNQTDGGMNVAHAAWAGSSESAFLDIFLLNGLAELALAEADLPTARVRFARAVDALARTYSGKAGIRGQMSVAAGVQTTVGLSVPTVAMTGVPASVLSADSQPRTGNMPIGLSVAGLGPAADRRNENAVAGGLAGGSIGAGVFNLETGGIGELVLVPSVLAGVAKLAVGIDSVEIAARLFGAAEHLRGLTHAIHREGRMILFERAYSEAVAQTRQALGDNVFDIAHREGQEMSSNQAIVLASEVLGSAAE
jgi:hypothetical protein